MKIADYLGCASCPELIEVSEEDPDVTLSDAAEHQRRRHGIYDFHLAMASVTEVTR